MRRQQTSSNASDVFDPESPADQLVVAAEAIRRAWSDAVIHAARLDHLADMLRHGAELCGVAIEYQPHDGALLALCVDAADTDRTELFKAWNNRSGRVGRWAPILHAHGQIRAHNLDDFTPCHPDDGKVEPPPPFDPVIRRPSKRVVIA